MHALAASCEELRGARTGNYCLQLKPYFNVICRLVTNYIIYISRIQYIMPIIRGHEQTSTFRANALRLGKFNLQTNGLRQKHRCLFLVFSSQDSSQLFFKASTWTNSWCDKAIVSSRDEKYRDCYLLTKVGENNFAATKLFL